MRTLALMAVTAWCAAAASGQDKKDDAKELLKKALDVSQKAGGVTVSGSVSREDPFGGMGGQFGALMGEGIEGDFTATIGANGITTVKVENENGVYELFQKGEKVVQRQTWTGQQIHAGAFAHEVTSILSLARLGKHLDQAKDLKKGDTKKVGDVECVPVRGLFPAALAEEPGAEGPMNLKLQELKKIEATIWIGREDHLVRSIEMKLTKGFSSAIRLPGGGDEDDDEGDEDEGGGQGFGMGKMKFVSTYRLTLKGYDKTTTVDVPAELKKFLND